MTGITRFIVKNSFLLSFLLLVAGAWPLAQIAQIKVDNAIDVWLDHSSPEYLQYQQFQKDYGSDEWLVVAFARNGKTADSLSVVDSVANSLRQVDSRIQVFSMADADALAMSRIGHLLLSADRQVAGILLNLAQMGTIADRQTLVAKIWNALAPFEKEIVFHLGGPPVLNAELDRISEQQSRIFMSLAAVAALLSLYALFRSFFYVATLIAAAGLAVGWTMGTAVGFGMTLNMISTVLPVLLWVLTLTGGIHLIFHFRKESGGDISSKEAVRRAIEAVFVPYCVAAFTTAIGFLSLLFSHMSPVRDLGIWAAAGIVIGFFSNLLILPALLQLGARLPVLKKRLQTRPVSVGPIACVRIRKNKKMIAAAGIAALLVPILLIPLLRAESNVLSFFKTDATIIRDYNFISRNLTGLSTIELDFRGSPDELEKYVREFYERLQAIDAIRPVLHIAGGVVRMSIFVDEMDSLAFNSLVERIRGIMAELPSDRVDTRLTGTIVLLNSIQEELVRTQVKSFALALAVIVTILAIIFRSVAMVVTGSIANLFPIMILAGIASVARIPLNVATIMIASIAIGIAVDDTVFFLVRLRREAAREGDADTAVDRTLEQMIGPISATTLVVAAGFLVLALADFTPIAYFGLLGGVTMILAWIGDIVLLPALLYCFHPHSGK